MPSQFDRPKPPLTCSECGNVMDLLDMWCPRCARREMDARTPIKRKVEGGTTPTHDKVVPEVSPRANFACVTLVFLEDWRDGRLSANEVCETLLAAAVSRGLVKGPCRTASIPAPNPPATIVETDSKNLAHLVDTAQHILKNPLDHDPRVLAELLLKFANVAVSTKS